MLLGTGGRKEPKFQAPEVGNEFGLLGCIAGKFSQAFRNDKGATEYREFDEARALIKL